jgi:hypothetical protein
MDSIIAEWICSIQQCNEDTLNQWASEISHLTIHTTYHIGQIIHIRKEQGSWEMTQGVH